MECAGCATVTGEPSVGAVTTEPPSRAAMATVMIGFCATGWHNRGHCGFGRVCDVCRNSLPYYFELRRARAGVEWLRMVAWVLVIHKQTRCVRSRAACLPVLAKQAAGRSPACLPLRQYTWGLSFGAGPGVYILNEAVARWLVDDGGGILT